MIKIIKGLKYVLKYKKQFIFFILLTLIIWAIEFVYPMLSGKFIDLILYPTIKKEIIYKFLILMLILSLSKIVFNFLLNMIRAKLESNAVFDMRFDMIEYVKRLPLLYFKDFNSSYQNDQIAGDCNEIIRFFLDNIIGICIKISTFIIALIILFKINVTLSMFLVCLLPIHVLIYIFFKKPLFNSQYKLKEVRNKFFGVISNQLANIKYIKINATFEFFSQELRDRFKVVLENILTASRTIYFFKSCNMTITSISEIILFWIGGFQVLNGNMSIGQFTIINSYFIMLLNCENYFLNLGEQYQNTLASFKRLEQILIQSKENCGNEIIDCIESIDLKQLSFFYDKNQTIINKFNYKFEKGHIYSITGRNGVGKSTLINIIIGLYTDYYSGEVYYNDKNIKNINMYHLRKNNISVVEQEPNLLTGTLLENLINAKIDVNNPKYKPKIESIKRYIDLFDLDRFVNSLPNGLNTNISSEFITISGGEKQKLSIIRALIKNPDILIFDEPTSALDKSTTIMFTELLKEYSKNKIIFLITHDIDLLINCENINCNNIFSAS